MSIYQDDHGSNPSDMIPLDPKEVSENNTPENRECILWTAIVIVSAINNIFATEWWGER